MQAVTATNSRKFIGFLLAAIVVSSGFFYAPTVKAVGERQTFFLIENGSMVTIDLSNGNTIEADDEDTYEEGLLFSELDETQVFGIAITTTSYKIHFKASSGKINFSLYSGLDEGIDASLHYYDLSVATGTKAEVSVTNSTVSGMKFDVDNNGSYETTPTASYSKIGSSVSDSDEPFLEYSQSGATLTVDAEEATAVKKIYYSTTVRTGRLIGNASTYTSPLNLTSLGLSLGDSIYFMAEDTVGNRGIWEEYVIIETGQVGPTPTPTPVGQVTPTPTPTPFPTGSLSQLYVGKNIKCGDTIYYVNQYTQKEGYPSMPVFLAWNPDFTEIHDLDAATCDIFPYGGTTRLPDNSLVKVEGNKTVWKTEGSVAHPIATYEAMLRIDSTPNIITISIPYLHTYSGGGAIY